MVMLISTGQAQCWQGQKHEYAQWSACFLSLEATEPLRQPLHHPRLLVHAGNSYASHVAAPADVVRQTSIFHVFFFWASSILFMYLAVSFLKSLRQLLQQNLIS